MLNGEYYHEPSTGDVIVKTTFVEVLHPVFVFVVLMNSLL